MTKRRKWTAIPGLLALAAAAVLLSAYSGASSSQGDSPTQPINFPHPVHVQKLGMNCLYCHYTANKSPDPGLPAVGTCMGCHTIIGPQRPASDNGPARTSTEIQKLTQYATSGKPIPWVRIHKVPEYVHFPHMRHVNVGVTCQTCHGQVQKMQQVYQSSSLNMGWCVKCHLDGYTPQQGLEAAGYASADAGTATLAGAAQTPATSAPAQPAPTSAQSTSPTGGVRKARYDCANCHY